MDLYATAPAANMSVQFTGIESTMTQRGDQYGSSSGYAMGGSVQYVSSGTHIPALAPMPAPYMSSVSPLYVSEEPMRYLGKRLHVGPGVFFERSFTD